MEAFIGNGKPVKQIYSIINEDGTDDGWETDKYSEVVDALRSIECVQKTLNSWIEDAQCPDGDMVKGMDESEIENFIFEKAEEAATECGIRVAINIREIES